MKRAYETCDLMHGNICVSEPCICKGMHMAEVRTKKKEDNRGGKRAGAGRPKLKKSEKKEPTKVMRIPISKIEEINEILQRKKA